MTDATDLTKGITTKKADDMSDWYNQVVLKAEIADFSDVKGCMVIRPLGFSIWEAIQWQFDQTIKAHGVRNAYFPLLIPESLLTKEEEHVEGFAPEVAWVTHAGDSKLEERYAIRPTSETTICTSYSKWIRSHRDLPLLINQWANVMRWETKATRPFLRSREFLWQEGHCLYETDEECEEDTLHYLREYEKLAQEFLGVAVIAGKKSKAETFAGARHTYTIEGFMPDGKALQMGTSHHLDQTFAKAFDIQYLGKDEQHHYPFQNSWGISTRLIGGMIMTHSDDQGLVLPPRVAYNKVVIVPIIFDKTKETTFELCKKVRDLLSPLHPLFDDREDVSSGWKYNHWEMKGVPLRIEIGPKDVEKNAVMVVRRDNRHKESVPVKEIKKRIPEILEEMQADLFAASKQHLDESIVEVKTFDQLIEATNNRKLVYAPFCGGILCEEQIKDKTTGVTSRCSPLEGGATNEPCVHCKEPSITMMYFSRSY